MSFNLSYTTLPLCRIWWQKPLIAWWKAPALRACSKADSDEWDKLLNFQLRLGILSSWSLYYISFLLQGASYIPHNFLQQSHH